jgi:hypothetical protein
LSGDTSAQNQLGNITADATKQIVMDTANAIKNGTDIMLDSTAETAGLVSDFSGKLALGAIATKNGGLASAAGTISTISGGIEAGVLVGKAFLTGAETDVNKAKKALSGFTVGFILGNIGLVLKGSEPLKNTATVDEIIDFLSVIAPEIYKAINE